MKHTITMWGIISTKKKLNSDTLAMRKKDCIANAEEFYGESIKRLSSWGYRCRKVTISWEAK